MGADFLGFEFQPVRLEHRERLQGLLSRYPQPLSGFTFATLMAWDAIFNYGWWSQVSPELLLISYVAEGDPNRHLLQPVGVLEEPMAEELLRRLAALPYRARLVGVTEQFLAEQQEFASHFELEESPAGANYLYSAEELATLAGKRFSKKRNLIAQAHKLYRWSAEPLTDATVPDCQAVVAAILSEEHPEIPASLAQEMQALEFTLRHFGALGQQGTLLRVEGEPVAFSIWEPMSPTTAVVHFERSLRRFKGAYQLVNQETAKEIVSRGFEFINREEDLGDPGLRQAKESYNPIALVKSYGLTLRGRSAQPSDSNRSLPASSGAARFELQLRDSTAPGQ